VERAVIDAEVRALSVRVLDTYRARKWRLATAESCTGGLVAGALTEIAGSSDVVDRGFVTYADEATAEMLGVAEATLTQYGAVSRPTAEAMAKGALVRSSVDATVAITGIAGPGGGSAQKPVGLVHFAAAARDGRLSHREKRYGDIGRAEIRRLSVIEALGMLLELAA
jgi:nicotinamide-nucleotide amidase